MTKKRNKFSYLWIIQGHYGQGWEDVAASESYTEARNNLRLYRENEIGPHRNHRMIQRRELNEVSA